MNIATLPSASPSMYQNSQSGRERSSGRANRWPASSPSSFIPPGAGTAIRCTCLRTSKSGHGTQQGGEGARPLLDRAQELLVAEVRHAGGIEDAHAADVTPGSVGLGGEEDGIA